MIQLFDFLTKHTGKYRVNQEKHEVQVEVCPFCKRTEADNLYKFNINTEKNVFHCSRSSCDAKGHVGQLYRKFNETFDSQNVFEKKEKRETFLIEIKKIETISLDLSPSTKKYITGTRKLSVEIFTKYHCRAEKITGNIIIPIYRNGELVAIKKRLIVPTHLKSILLSGSETKDLIGTQNIIDFIQPLVICEGEMDLFAIAESGHGNVVSVMNGCSDINWIEYNREFLTQFKKIILWYDNEKAGLKATNEMTRIYPSLIIHKIIIGKDANDILIEHGKEKVREVIADSIPCEIKGIIDIHDIDRKSLKDISCFTTGFKGLDKILKGMRNGELTVFTGKNQSGKSTILGQITLNAVSNSIKTFVYSGELPKRIYKEWIVTQADGGENTVKYLNEVSEEWQYQVDDEAYKDISAWLSKKIYLYDLNDTACQSELLKMMEVAYFKLGCQLFIIDNLMTVSFESNENFYKQQSGFIRELKNFSKSKDVHVILVAHPKKTGDGKVQKEDISGSGDISNLCDNVIIVERMQDTSEFDCIIDVQKNRMWGHNGKFGLCFDGVKRRFYSPTTKVELFRKYDYKTQPQTAFELPF